MRTLGSSQAVILWVLAAIMGAGPQAWADEVRLTNGDRLTGKVVKLEEGSLTLNTTYAGDIKISWKEVESLTTDEPVTTRMEDGFDFRGRLEQSKPGRVILKDPDTESEMPLALTSIQAINPPPDFRYEGETSLGGNITSGNTDTQAINASTRWYLHTDSHEFLIEGKYNYGEADGQLTVRNARGDLDYGYSLTKKWFLVLEQLLEQDSFQELEIRSTTSGGIGYRFFNTKRHKLRVSARLAYVLQQFEGRSIQKITSSNWKVTWRYWLVPDHVRLFHRQQGFKDYGGESTAFRWNADQGFEVPVYKGLYMNVEYDVRFNSDPEPGRKKTDSAFIFGVGWKIEN